MCWSPARNCWRAWATALARRPASSALWRLARRDGTTSAVWQPGEQSFEPWPLVTNDYLHLRSRAVAAELVTDPPFLAATP